MSVKESVSQAITLGLLRLNFLLSHNQSICHKVATHRQTIAEYVVIIVWC